jgi:hypothetical protein
MGHFVEREIIVEDDELSLIMYSLTGGPPFPLYFIDDVEGCYYYSFAVDKGVVLYNRKEL